MHTYSAYYLTISSELLLPELCLANNLIKDEQPHVSIVFGHAPRESVLNARVQGLSYSLQPEVCWFEIPNITRFLIKQGRQIIVEPFSGIDEDSIRLFLYTTAIPLVLIYHNFFLLHGGSVCWNKDGIAFLANFGQGKSTLLATLLQRDYSLLSDDICVLNPQGFIMPGIPHLQLQEDVLKKLNIERNTLKLIRPKMQKWFTPVQHAFNTKPCQLKIIYMINATNRCDFSFTPLVGLKKILCLKKYIYHPLFVKGLGKDLLYFHQCAALASRTMAIYVEKTKEKSQWHELANKIATDLQNKGLECR